MDYSDVEFRAHDYPDYPDNQGNRRAVAATKRYIAADATIIWCALGVYPSQNDKGMKPCYVRKNPCDVRRKSLRNP